MKLIWLNGQGSSQCAGEGGVVPGKNCLSFPEGKVQDGGNPILYRGLSLLITKGSNLEAGCTGFDQRENDEPSEFKTFGPSPAGGGLLFLSQACNGRNVPVAKFHTCKNKGFKKSCGGNHAAWRGLPEEEEPQEKKTRETGAFQPWNGGIYSFKVSLGPQLGPFKQSIIIRYLYMHYFSNKMHF